MRRQALLPLREPIANPNFSENMPTKRIFKSPRAPFYFGITGFVFLLLLTQLATYQHYLLYQSANHREMTNAVNLAKEKLQTALGHSLSATETLSFIVRQYGPPANFDSTATAILASNKYIDAIELVDSGTIINVYPLKGNESALGYNVLADTAKRIEAIKAIERRQLFFAGPFELKQGGIGIVGRLPIFIDNRFWGFAVTIVHLQTILDAAGLSHPENPAYQFQLSKKNPVTGQEEFFLPNPELFSKENSAFVGVPNGEWQIYVRDKKFNILNAVLPFTLLGILLSLTGGLLGYYIARQPLRLENLVAEKSEQLSATQENYRTTLERVSDAFVALDKNWNYTYMNHKAGEILQRKPEDMIGKNIWAEFPGGVNQPFYKAFHQAMREQKFTYLEEYYPSDNKWFENYIYPSPDGLSVFLRDVSERKYAEQLIDAEKKLSASIINSLPGVFYMYDEHGRFMQWNKNFELVTGFSAEEILHISPLDFFRGEEKELLRAKVAEVFANGSAWVEAEFYNKDDKATPYYFTGQSIVVNGRRCLMGVGIDISERKKAEAAIRISEERYRYLFNNSPSCIIIWDLVSLRILQVNDATVKTYGYTKEEFETKTVLAIRPAEDHARIKAFARQMLQQPESLSTNTWKHLNSKGEVMYMNISSHRITYNNRLAILSVGEDVTQRFLMEAELRKSYDAIRQLNAHLDKIREEERAGIAREIHDELGQQLTVLKMDAAWLKSKLAPDNTEALQRLADMLLLIDNTVKTVRRIASDLRPGVLDDLGIIAALEWQSSEFEKRTGIKVRVQTTAHEVEMNTQTSNAVFRVYQEILTNVARHSAATQVDTTIELSNNTFCLSVQDNGNGFDQQAAKEKKTLGLLGMAERVNILHGELYIDTLPGKGTRITVKVPLSKT